MKRLVVTVLVLLIAASLTSAFAGGDKNRGDKGQGAVVQEQIRNQDCGTPAFDSKE